MEAFEVISFQDKYLSEAEQILKNNLDIFTQDECVLYRKNLLQYLIDKPDRKKAHIYLLKVADKIEGMIMYTKVDDAHNYYKIEWLAINPAQQGKGYGTKLMKLVLETVKQLEGKHIYVETANENYNEKTKKFYEHLGFEPMGVLPAYYPPPKDRKRLDDYVIYFKNL